MGLKLIKTMGDGWPVYSLRREDNKRIATTRWPFDEPSLMIARGAGIELQKLSHENCDELFGVINAEKLAEEWVFNENGHKWSNNDDTAGDNFSSYREGFNKAMELNRDKVFTVDDVITAIIHHTYLLHNDGKGYDDGDDNDNRIDYVIAALKQQPKEIEVEIEMVKVVDKTKVIGAVKGVKGSGHKIKTYKSVPKLDEKGCLILKKI